MSTYLSKLRPANVRGRDLTIRIAGQSLTEAFNNRSSLNGLVDTLRAGGALTTFLNQQNVAVGGSVADRASSDNPGANTLYWYDVAADAPGPLLTAALAKIGSAPAAVLVCDLGQTEALYLGPGLNSKANYKTAYTKIVTPLMANVTGPLIMPIIGRRDLYTQAPGVQIVREAQLELAAELPFNVRKIDAFDLDLYDDVHPKNVGYVLYGRRVGQAILNAYAPPRITALNPSGASIDAVLSAPIGNTAGTVVNGFAGRIGTSYEVLSGTVLNSTTIRLSLNPGSTTPSMSSFHGVVFPFDNVPDLTSLARLPRAANGTPVVSVVF